MKRRRLFKALVEAYVYTQDQGQRDKIFDVVQLNWFNIQKFFDTVAELEAEVEKEIAAQPF